MNCTTNCESAFSIDASRAFMRIRFQILAICVGLLRSLARKALQQIHQQIVEQAKEATIIAGKKLRTDTTAVETNIHHPTDSSLLADSVRVMSRSLQRIAGGCQESELRIVHHARAVKHRVLEIGRAARTCTQAGQEQLKQSYKKLIGLTQGVRTQGLSVLRALKNGQLVEPPPNWRTRELKVK